MRIWYNNVVDTQRRVLEVQGDRVRIGRDAHNDLVLHSPYIAPEAAVLTRRGPAWEIQVLGMNGIQLGDEQLSAGEQREISSNVVVEIFPYTVSLELPRAEQMSQDAARRLLDNQMAEVLGALHRELLDRMDLRRGLDVTQQNNQDYQLRLERHLESIAAQHPQLASSDSDLIAHLAGHALRDYMLRPAPASNANAQEEETTQAWSRIVTTVPEREKELDATSRYLAKVLQIDGSESAENIPKIEEGFWPAWQELRNKIHIEFRGYLALRRIKKEIKDMVFGYGPLEDLLRLSSVSEIMVVDRSHIYVESQGTIKNSGRQFISDEIVESIIQRIVGKVGRRIDKSQPLVDARLSDGSRVNAVIAPLAVSGPTLTIRKFPERKILIHDLVALGALSSDVAEFLRAVVLSRRNVVVSGGTGTGKTTLLNCLSDFIPAGERIVTIEDTAELQLAKEHVVRMETKEANVEGAGAYSIRDLVRNALRMRPDRVVVGECRGPEALDMLQAMNTGHDGSLTTIHANSAHDVSLRLEVLVQMAADLPVASIRSQIGSAVDVIVQLERLSGGRRVVSQIAECVGVNPVTGQLDIRELYGLDESQHLQPTGQLPSFIGELLERDLLKLDTFYESQPT
ncbi:MAG: Flp pilus assembly complex ATPase component TadA [Planctomycetales bacterium]|nr:Flp pilus assembly complex ATPase component TadA [Planctomycetales bacterium]